MAKRSAWRRRPFSAIRYHSLCATAESLPESLHITAKSDSGVIMAIKHTQHPIEGVQFHSESFLTEHGHALLDNFLARLPERGRASAARKVPS